MSIKVIGVALALLSLAGCGDGGGGSTADLDEANGLWLGSKDGKSLILYTYQTSSEVLMDIAREPARRHRGQYDGSRAARRRRGTRFSSTASARAAPLSATSWAPR